MISFHRSLGEGEEAEVSQDEDRQVAEKGTYGEAPASVLGPSCVSADRLYSEPRGVSLSLPLHPPSRSTVVSWNNTTTSANTNTTDSATFHFPESQGETESKKEEDDR